MIKTWLSDDYHEGPSRQNKKIPIQWDYRFFKDVLFRRSTRQSFRNLFTTQACSHCVEAHSVAIAIHFNSSASICLEPLVIDPVGHVVNSTSLSWFSNNSYFFTSWSGSSSLCPRLQVMWSTRHHYLDSVRTAITSLPGAAPHPCARGCSL